VPHFGGHPLEDVRHAAGASGVLFFQLYPPRDPMHGALDREYTAQVLQHVHKSGCTAVLVTVDTPVDGNREKTYRNPHWVSQIADEVGAFPAVRTLQAANLTRHPGMAKTMSWEDIAWIKAEALGMKVVVKGVLTREDASMAATYADAIVVSNHGGRQLDYARSGIEMLVEIMDALNSIGADLEKFTVLVDGGFRRGSDVFKALALGAKGVGLGRPTLVGMASYGEEGVEKVIQIFKDEMEMHMRLMGTPTIKDMTPDLVITRNVADHFSPAPIDFLSQQVYDPLPLATRISKL